MDAKGKNRAGQNAKDPTRYGIGEPAALSNVRHGWRTGESQDKGTR